MLMHRTRTWPLGMRTGCSSPGSKITLLITACPCPITALSVRVGSTGAPPACASTAVAVRTGSRRWDMGKNGSLPLGGGRSSNTDSYCPARSAGTTAAGIVFGVSALGLAGAGGGGFGPHPAAITSAKTSPHRAETCAPRRYVVRQFIYCPGLLLATGVTRSKVTLSFSGSIPGPELADKFTF